MPDEQEQYRTGERGHKTPAEAADQAIAAEVNATNRESNHDSQSDENSADEAAPMSRAERRAAQFNKKGSAVAPSKFGEGKVGPGGAAGAPRGPQAPAKHSGRGK